MTKRLEMRWMLVLQKARDMAEGIEHKRLWGYVRIIIFILLKDCRMLLKDLKLQMRVLEYGCWECAILATVWKMQGARMGWYLSSLPWSFSPRGDNRVLFSGRCMIPVLSIHPPHRFANSSFMELSSNDQICCLTLWRNHTVWIKQEQTLAAI